MRRIIYGVLLLSVPLVLLLTGCRSVQKDLRRIGSDGAEDRRAGLISMTRALSEKEPTYLQKKADIAAAARKLLRDPNALVRCAAIRTLAEIEGPRATAEFFDALKDERDCVRFEAVKALERFLPPAAVDPLINVVKADPHPWVRLTAAKVLGSLQEKKTIPALVEALRDEDAGVRHQAYLSLTCITGVDKGPRYADWDHWLQKK